eukprot:TRINITY_DN57753_c0_g1_i1.p1 TRINITY_DN57753_c0_g1~~TRINITY_DN57753_c0_g1_i1.p1  ORF type:complete len:210 (+),score=8.28 TRINITY_DN57753_c0_g1_i1:267-896(+)
MYAVGGVIGAIYGGPVGCLAGVCVGTIAEARGAGLLNAGTKQRYSTTTENAALPVPSTTDVVVTKHTHVGVTPADVALFEQYPEEFREVLTQHLSSSDPQQEPRVCKVQTSAEVLRYFTFVFRVVSSGKADVVIVEATATAFVRPSRTTYETTQETYNVLGHVHTQAVVDQQVEDETFTPDELRAIAERLALIIQTYREYVDLVSTLEV